MFRLAYLSHASDPFLHTDLAQILATARRKNPAADLTGMLIFHQGTFLQFLEGPEAQVRACYAQIQQDPRHHGHRILSEGPVQSRAFSDWSMGFIAPDELPSHLAKSVRDLRDIAARVKQAHAMPLSDGKKDVAMLIARFLERAEPALMDE